MFSQASVKNSVRGVGEGLPHFILGYTPRQTPPLSRRPLTEMATVVGGTHPIGMHSCFRFRFGLQTKWLHFTMRNVSYYRESDSDSNHNCQLREWNWNLNPCECE